MLLVSPSSWKSPKVCKSGVAVPSLVMLLEADVFKKRRREIIELGGPLDPGWWWFKEPLEALDFGWVVVVISLPIEVRPDSELALQFPELEFCSSFCPNPCRLCLRINEDSRNFTGFKGTGIVESDATATLFSLCEEYEGFRSCESFLSFSFSCWRLRNALFIRIVSCVLKSSISETCLSIGCSCRSLSLPLLPPRNEINRNLLRPHCLRVLKWLRRGTIFSSFFKISLDLLLGTRSIPSASTAHVSPLASLNGMNGEKTKKAGH